MEIAKLARNERRKLEGFRVLGIFPFYLKFIRLDVHIKLCDIRERIKEILPNDSDIDLYYNSQVQKKIIPLIREYCLVGLINGRKFSRIFRFFLKKSVNNSEYESLLNIYINIHQLNEPCFFLTICKLIKTTPNTLLKEEKQ